MGKGEGPRVRGPVPEGAKTDGLSRRRAGIRWWTGPMATSHVTASQVAHEARGSRWRHVAVARRDKFIGDRRRPRSFPTAQCPETAPDAAILVRPRETRPANDRKYYIKAPATTDGRTGRRHVRRLLRVHYGVYSWRVVVRWYEWLTGTNCFCDVRWLTGLMKRVLIRNHALKEAVDVVQQNDRSNAARHLTRHSKLL